MLMKNWLNRGLWATVLAGILLVGIYILIFRVLTLIAQNYSSSFNVSWIVFISTLIVALAFFPLRMSVQGFIDRTFYQDELDYSELLPELSGASLPR